MKFGKEKTETSHSEWRTRQASRQYQMEIPIVFGKLSFCLKSSKGRLLEKAWLWIRKSRHETLVVARLLLYLEILLYLNNERILLAYPVWVISPEPTVINMCACRRVSQNFSRVSYGCLATTKLLRCHRVLIGQVDWEAKVFKVSHAKECPDKRSLKIFWHLLQ